MLKLKLFSAGPILPVSGALNRWVWTICLTAGLSIPAHAQVSTDEPEQDNSETGAVTEARRGVIEEIVVTAQKRQQSINDVGMAITALSGEQLRDAGIRDVGDLTKVEPSFVVSQAFYGTPVYSIRGIGYNEQSLAASPTVSIYVDEVPYAYPALTKGAPLDIERVEILKGPQGTLFGQNATGGAIDYIAAKPTDYYTSAVNFTYERFDETNLNGYFSGPLTDQLNARVAFDMSEGGAWQKSYTHGGSLGDNDMKRARLLLDWQALETLKVSLNINGWTDRSDAMASQLYAVNLQVPAAAEYVPETLAYPLAPRESSRAADWSPDSPPSLDETFFQTSLRVDYVLSDSIDLTSISSIQRYRQDNLVENDGMSLDNNAERQRGTVDSLVQELRLAGVASDDRLHWLAGLTYSKDETKENNIGILPDSSPGHQPELGGAPSFSTIGTVAEPTVNAKAVFGNLEYQLFDELSIHGGARYTETKMDFDACLYVVDPNFAASFAPFGFDLQPGDCVTFGSDFMPGLQHLSLDEDNVSWRVGADWTGFDDTLIYATVSQGYKAGSFPTLPGTGVIQFAPVTQESLQAYELGFKTELFDYALSLGGAVFRYEYEDKQLRGKVLDPTGVFGIIDALVNVPKSVENGAELTATWRPDNHLRMNAGLTWLDPEVDGTFLTYDPFAQPDPETGAAPTPTDFDGYSFPGVPEWSANVGLRYEWSLPSGMIASLSADYRYQTDSQGQFVASDSVEQGNASLKIDSYGLLDLRAGLESADGAWTLAVFGKNVTDEYYWTQATKVYDATVRYVGMPLTYGITIGHRFSAE